MDDTTDAAVSCSAIPSNRHARVRPCNVSACTPTVSAKQAISTAFFLSGDQPVLVLSVTGIDTAETTASKISLTNPGSRNRAEPASFLHTFFAGHPILISIISAPVCS